jgi:hypothetical protein
MRLIALCILFTVAACAEADANANQPADMQGWKMASGKSPTKAEFAAVVAACQDRAVPAAQEKLLDACLGDLGLKRVE